MSIPILALTVIGFGMPVLTVNVAHTQEAAVTDANEAGMVTAQATGDKEPGKADTMAMAEGSASGSDFEYDPWESFNEKMFWFNREVLDRFVLKPAATAWNFVLPDPAQRGIHNVFDNLAVVRRVVNNALQLKFAGAAKEAARFTINSTIGVVGFFDVAKEGFGIDQSDEDMGQTFGVWGDRSGSILSPAVSSPTNRARRNRICCRRSDDPVCLFHPVVR